MSKKLIFFILITISFTKYCFAGPKHHFVPGMSDLPVPINFSLQKDSSSIFISDSGNLVEATFRGRGEKNAILEFYRKTLKALGWKRINKEKFSREGEFLTITLIPIQDNKYHNLEIQFLIKPE